MATPNVTPTLPDPQTMGHVAYLAGCIAEELSSAQRVLENAISNEDMDSACGVLLQVCRAGLMSDLLHQAAGGAGVLGGASEWFFSEGQVQRLEALRATAQQTARS
jgi:hypothetical protein